MAYTRVAPSSTPTKAVCASGKTPSARRPSMPGGRPSIDKTRHPKKRALQAAFLAALAQTGGNILRAAQVVGMSRDLHYEWLAGDEKYPARFAAAWDRAVDALEAEAARRAFEGVVEPVFHAGRRALDLLVDENGQIKRKPDGTPEATPAGVRKYSDTLLIFLL